MKISEKLAELKQMEGELMRKYNLRDSIAKQSFKETMLAAASDMNKAVLETEAKKFMEDKKRKVNEMTNSINKLQEKIVEGRNAINKRNIQNGLDRKLIEMKFLRLELSKLMALIKTDRYFSRDMGIDIDIFEELGISNRISELEIKKSKLESEIQHSNWSIEL